MAYRKQFLDKLAELDRRTIASDGIRPELEDGEKPLIRVVHDKSTFYAKMLVRHFPGVMEKPGFCDRSL